MNNSQFTVSTSLIAIHYPLPGVIVDGIKPTATSSIVASTGSQTPGLPLVITWKLKWSSIIAQKILFDDDRYYEMMNQNSELFIVCKNCATEKFAKKCDGKVENKVTTSCPEHYICHAGEKECCKTKALPLAMHCLPVPPGQDAEVMTFWIATKESRPTFDLSFVQGLRSCYLKRPALDVFPQRYLPAQQVFEHVDDCLEGHCPDVKIQNSMSMERGGIGLVKAMYFKRCNGDLMNLLSEKLHTK